MRKIIIAVLLAALSGLFLFGGCAAEIQKAEAAEPAAGTLSAELPKQTRVGFYLDTVITLTAYTDHPELLEKALETCGTYEQLLSRTVEGSDVWQINHAEGKTVTVSPETAEILRTAVQISELSGGAFDVTIAPASTLWDFTSGEQKIPAEDELAAAAEKIDWRKVQLEGNDVTLPAGMMIDLGGIAKGYIADELKSLLESKGVKHALINLGGNVLAVGGKKDGSPFKVGIQYPFKNEGEIIAAADVKDRSLVTSGSYERYVESDGKIWHHILDPKTGYAVDNDLVSVTICCESSLQADALSTSLFLLGLERGAKLIEQTDGVSALIITDDYELHTVGDFPLID